MDSGHDEKRTNVEEDDRLSSLPDDLIHKVLSFIGIKTAIETSVLSSRWRFVWTSMPYLDFSTEDFSTLPKFYDFVTHVLSHRDNEVEAFSMKLCFCGDVSLGFVKQIMDYAFSHNIRQLNIVCFPKNNDIELPLSLFSSQSLKHLSLTSEFVYDLDEIFPFPCDLTTMSTLELPALTTLYLGNLTLCLDNSNKCPGLFPKCTNLKSLTLSSCKMTGLNGLLICHPLLSSLTLEDITGSINFVIVVAPQLKNLTIRWNDYEHLISAPDLASFLYRGYHPLHLSTKGFHFLEKVDLSVYGGSIADAPKIVRLFQQLRSVKFLTLSLEVVELLSSSVELISNQPSPFANLKSLNIYPEQEFSEEKEQKKVKMSSEVKSYLLDGSPSATFTMVSREEIRAVKNTKLAQNLMAELLVLLEQEKAKTETKRAQTEQAKTQAENQLQIGGRVKHVNRCWKDMIVQIEQGESKTSDIILKLKEIKRLLKKLPTSNRAEMETCFSSLCAKADTVVNNILDRMKTQCDMKGSCFSVYFHELAST